MNIWELFTETWVKGYLQDYGQLKNCLTTKNSTLAWVTTHENLICLASCGSGRELVWLQSTFPNTSYWSYNYGDSTCEFCDFLTFLNLESFVSFLICSHPERNEDILKRHTWVPFSSANILLICGYNEQISVFTTYLFNWLTKNVWPHLGCQGRQMTL